MFKYREYEFFLQIFGTPVHKIQTMTFLSYMSTDLSENSFATRLHHYSSYIWLPLQYKQYTITFCTEKRMAHIIRDEAGQ
jgi:hypothetical protein